MSEARGPDPYEVLGVVVEATVEEIKIAYRRQVRTCHPDLHGDDPSLAERFNRVSVAYQLLSRPLHRQFYDKYKVDPEAYGLEHAEIVASLRERRSLYVAPDDLLPRANCTYCNGTGKRPSGRICTKCSTTVRPVAPVVERPVRRTHSRYKPAAAPPVEEPPIASQENKRMRMKRQKKATRPERMRFKK